MGPSRITRTGLAVGAIVVAFACADPATSPPRVLTPEVTLGFLDQVGDNTPVREYFKVCKVYRGTDGGDVTINVDDGTTDQDVTLANGQCKNVYIIGGSGLNVTVTEAPVTGYTTTFVKTQLNDPDGPGPVQQTIVTDAEASGNSATGFLGGNPGGGAVVTFYNTEEVDNGCTYTQGYWKTHSSYGPAGPEDDGWDNVGGPDAPFFGSGKTWIEVFNTPVAGNKYYQLAYQYMAAKLNILNGASSTTAVDAAITAAEAYFNNPVGNPPGGLAGTLAAYNEGLTGPGHCDD